MEVDRLGQAEADFDAGLVMIANGVVYIAIVFLVGLGYL
jgi:hypothetical protein